MRTSHSQNAFVSGRMSLEYVFEEKVQSRLSSRHGNTVVMPPGGYETQEMLRHDVIVDRVALFSPLSEGPSMSVNSPVTSFDAATWIKSTRSAGNGACVEIARAGSLVGVRDSKYPDGPILVFTPDEWSAFVEGIADGEMR